MLMPGVVAPQVQDFALPLVELCEAPVSPFLQPFLYVGFKASVLHMLVLVGFSPFMLKRPWVSF